MAAYGSKAQHEDVPQACILLWPAGKAKAKQDKPRAASKKQPAVGETLEERLAVAEAEAQRLRHLVEATAIKKLKLEPESPKAESEEEDTAPEKPLNHRERKRQQRAAYKAAKRDLLKNQKAAIRKQRKKEQQTEQKTQATVLPIDTELDRNGARDLLDMSAWKPYELDSRVEKALSDMGFTSPTPIQQECLPSAIRDRRDVIGAAQTVSPLLLRTHSRYSSEVFVTTKQMPPYEPKVYAGME